MDSMYLRNVFRFCYCYNVMCTYMGQDDNTCAYLSAQELLNSEIKVLPESRHFSLHTELDMKVGKCGLEMS